MNKHREFKDRLYEQLSRVGQALSSPKRLELLDLLAQAERSVEDLAGLTGMSIANTSQHLQQLRKAHLVRVRRQGLYMFYSLAGEEAFGAWKGIRDFGQSEVAEVDRLVQSFLSDRAKLEPMTAADLLARIEKDDVTVLDVRPAVEYEAGHIKGARSIPVDEIEGHLKSLRRSREVIAYCRGPYCVYADQAVQTLTRRGYRARRLEIGFPDWRAAGLPVSASGEVDRRKRKVST